MTKSYIYFLFHKLPRAWWGARTWVLETSEKGECGMMGLMGTSTELEGEVMGKIFPYLITTFAPALLKD